LEREGGEQLKYKIIEGNCLDGLRSIPDQSVQVCVTSPPYYGLRDYGHNDQIGLEDTPDQYIKKMSEVFREVYRVLNTNGSLWLNIGDSYASFRDGKAIPDSQRGNNTGTLVPKGSAKNRMATTFRGTPIKHKDLIGIPWMLAFALRESGWYLRQDIIWHKPNPMPESITDRNTKAHEYLFLLTKSAKYYFDADAIKEKSKSKSEGIKFEGNKYGDSIDPKHSTKSGNVSKEYEFVNKRSVWTIPSKPFRGAHFAVMPEALAEPCILAGSKPGDTILDPFTGSGTVAVVALRNNRNFIGCELNPEYIEIAHNRISGDAPLLNCGIKEEV
jgi:DNA modification methylase